MAKVFLNEDETYAVLGNSDVFGGIGRETLQIANPTAVVTVQSTVERIEFADDINAYTFRIEGNVVTVKGADSGSLLATISVPDTLNGQELVFADGSALLKITGLNAATLGGAAIPTASYGSVAAQLYPYDVSQYTVPDDDPDSTGNIFTLYEIPIVQPDPVERPEPTLMWGYDLTGKYDDDGRLIDGGGVPLESLVKFFQDIAGTDFFELGLIDDDGVYAGNIAAITIGLSGNASLSEASAEDSGQGDDAAIAAPVQISYVDGSVRVFEASIAHDYLDFLGDLLFTLDGTSRLFMGYFDEFGRCHRCDDRPELTPIVLTPTQNNGGTFEDGFTTALNDTIYVGRPELLHQAYIDGGVGYDILEVDMKGVFAQPLQLLRIEEIRIQNLPNVYQYDYDVSGDGYILDSTLDLSRATSLQKLVVTEGYGLGPAFEWDLNRRGDDFQYDFDDAEIVPLGTLTIVGVRNNAVTRLEGGFTEDVTIHYGQGIGAAVNLELLIGDTTADSGDGFNLKIAHNMSVLNILSDGYENVFTSGSFGGNLARLNISGTGTLTIENVLQGYRVGTATSPAIIDASDSTGGVNLQVANPYVKFIGSGAFTTGSAEGDYFTVSCATVATITATVGNNVFIADGCDVVRITGGSGNDYIMVEGGELVNIDTGAGNNVVFAAAEVIEITGGSGNDHITVAGIIEGCGGSGSDTDQDSVLLTIDTGAGTNTIVLGIDAAQFPFDADATAGIIALYGSSISGSNIKLFVENASCIKEADISGATFSSVLLKETLEISSSQFAQIGASKFKADPDAVHKGVMDGFADADSVTQAEIDAGLLIIRVAEGQTFDLSTVTDLASMSSTVNLRFLLDDGATLIVTAEQLHKYLAEDAVQGPFGTVIVNKAGLSFLVDDDKDASAVYGTIGLTDVDNIIINRALDGYNRPGDAPNWDRLYIPITGDTVITAPITYQTQATVSSTTIVAIYGVGDVDMTAAPLWLGAKDVAGYPSPTLNSANDFVINFASLNGQISGMTIKDFDDVLCMNPPVYPTDPPMTYGITGNDGTAMNPEGYTRINVELTGNVGYYVSGVGYVGLASKGVSEYVVTKIADNSNDDMDTNVDTATFLLCDNALDIKVLGLKENGGKTLTFDKVPWGQVSPTFLLEGDGYADWNSMGGLKADLSPNYSNIGTLIIKFAALQSSFPSGVTSLAPAIVNINNGGVPLGFMSDGVTCRAFMVDGIKTDNAISLQINVTEGDAIISAIAETTVGAGELSILDLNASGHLTISSALPAVLDIIDASDVAGVFTAALNDMAGAFTLTGSDAGNILTLNSLTADAGTVIDGGAAGADLIITGTSSLVSASLTNVDVVLQNGASLSLTFNQAYNVIGIDDITHTGTPNATLNLYGLTGDIPFVVPALAAKGIDIGTITIAAGGTVTLHEDANLTGVGALSVPAGTTLELTMAQFQQLTGDGTITGDGSVHIYDVYQADVGVEGGDLDLDSVDIDGTLTITLAESVDLSDADLRESGAAKVDVFNFADDATLTLGDVRDADGVTFNGGTLSFSDTGFGFWSSIDASGFNVDTLMILNVLAAAHNVDLMFGGLPEDVLKVIYNGEGWAIPVNQTVDITEGTTVPGHLVFNPPADDTEIANFTLNMLGGTEIDGSLYLTTTEKVDEDDNDLMRGLLQSLNINSSGTEANLITGSAANIIDGDIDPMGTGWQFVYTSTTNNLLLVNIDASQALTVTGSIIFSSVVGDDAFTANDNYAATATLNVTGAAAVTIGDLNTQDDEVDFLVVNHAGAGALTVGLNAANIDATDIITFNGDAAGIDTIIITGAVNLSNDTLINVDVIRIEDNSTLTLQQSQLTGITLTTDGNPVNATLNIVNLGTAPFNAAAIPAGINVVDVTMQAGDITLDPATNLTGVDQLLVPEGSTVRMTAAQFQQLLGNGTVTGLNIDGDAGDGNPFTIYITDLTQADINHAVAFQGDAAGFNLTGISDTATVILDLAADVNLAANTDLDHEGFASLTVNLADGQTLGINNADQANALTVVGVGDTTIIFQFSEMPGYAYVPGGALEPGLDCSGYNVTTLKALATLVDGTNAEYNLDDLASSIELRLYHDPAELGFLDATYRNVFIEETVTVPGALYFNDWDATDEVRTLDITMDGGVLINGDVLIPTRTDKDGTLVQRYFDELTIFSQGDPTAENIDTENAFNVIDGDLGTQPATGAPNTAENNLLKVVIDATTQDLVITGDIIFRSIDDDDYRVANLTVSGQSDVTVEQLNVLDDDITTLNIANTGTGVLTVTGGSPAIFDDYGSGGNVEVLTFSGTGNIILGDDDLTTGETGINLQALSVLNAAGMAAGSLLDLGEVEGIDNDNFVFTAGSGVTNLYLTDVFNADLPISLGGVSTDTGWTFNFANAAAGSVFTLNGNNFDDGDGNNGDRGILNINLGANTTLVIASNTDLTDTQLTLTQGATTPAIVLNDNCILTLTAAQASGLRIVAGADTGAAGFTGRVNIVDLEDSSVDDAHIYDFSGIAANIAGTITLAVDDVTVDNDTDLGAFSITLNALSLLDQNLSGQTIRFWTVDQAERTILVPNAVADAGENSSNVVWLFDNISAPVDTSGYFCLAPPASAYHIGRLWFTEDLVDNEGGLVESLFTTLPTSVLRVDFTDITALNILLASNEVDRVMELAAFTTLGNLTFSDVGLNPEEHIDTLTIKMGGEVTIGNINLDDVVHAGYDPASVSFDGLYFESHRALSDVNFLAPELYVNNNNGTDEAGEHVQPINLNTVGNIGVGGVTPEIDLMLVDIDTLALSVEGNSSAGAGAVFNAGIITYNAEPATAGHGQLVFAGANDINITQVNSDDADVTGIDVIATGFTGTWTAPGASPGMQMNNTESLTFVNSNTAAADAAAVITLGSATNAGVAGNELSIIDASGYDGTLNLGVLAQIDSTNDDSTPATPANDGLLPAFTFTSGAGLTTLTLDTANGLTPTLAAGSKWIFDLGNAAGDETVGSLTDDSTLTITDNAVFGAGDLEIDTGAGAVLVIDGNVNFSTLRPDDPATVGVQEGLNFVDASTVIMLTAGSTLRMTDDQWIAEGGGLTFFDETGAAAVLHVTAALAASLGNDLTLVRGYTAYDIDLGVAVTLREDQADIAVVNGGLVPGVLTGANVTVFVQETNFGDQDIQNLVDVSALVIETDATGWDHDLNPLTPDLFGYQVLMTVEQADSLVGNITKNGNTVGAVADNTSGTDAADTFTVSLVDPAGDGSVPAYNLAEVDTLYVSDTDGTIINLAQLTAIGGGTNIVGDGSSPVILMASGDLTGVDLAGITSLIITGATTLTLAQVNLLTATGTITETVASTLTVIDAELTGADTTPADGFIDQGSVITIDFTNVTVTTSVVFMDTNTIDPLDGVTVIDGLFTVNGNLNGATLSLTGNGTVTADVLFVDGQTVTGTIQVVNLTDTTVALNDPAPLLLGDDLDLSGVAAAIANTLTLGGATVLDPLTNLGAFDVVLGGFNFTGTVAQLNGLTVTGTGVETVVATNLGTAAVDLSGITNVAAARAELLDDTVTTAIALDPTTVLGGFDIDSLTTVTDLTLTAAQADGCAVADGGALADVIVTNLELTPGADLSGLNNANYNIDVQLDSTGGVQILAGADLSTITGAGTQVSVTGTGTVTAADETALGAGDGADVDGTNFVLDDNAILQTNRNQVDPDSVVTIANVTGDGRLQLIATDADAFTIFNTKVQETEIIVTGNNDGIVVTGFDALAVLSGAFVFGATGIGRHELNLNEALVSVVGGTGGGFQRLGDGVPGTPDQITLDTGLVVYNGDIATADAAGIEDLFDGATTDGLAFINALGAGQGDAIYLAADTGAAGNTYIWLISDVNGDGTFTAAADTATLIVTLVGVDDTANLFPANFTDFI